jgi:hypothetical protein
MQQYIFWCLKEWKTQRSIDNWLPSMDRTVCHNEVCTSGLKCSIAAERMLLMQTGKDTHPHPHRKKNMQRAQTIISGNCVVTTAEIAAKLGIIVARRWCRLLVECHTHSAQMGFNWTTLAVSHYLTLSYSMTRYHQCCQSKTKIFPCCGYFF